MLKKIEDIHELEVELVHIEGHNTSSKINRQQITSLAHRNEEVMAEIRRMLGEGGQRLPATAARLVAEYSREAREAREARQPHALQRHLQQRFHLLRGQIEQEHGFLAARVQVLRERLHRCGAAGECPFFSSCGEMDYGCG